MISYCWQGEGLKVLFVEGEEDGVRSHWRTLSMARKGFENDEEGWGVDTGAYSLFSIFFSVTDKVTIHSLEVGEFSVNRDWMIFQASTGSMLASARCL